MSISISKIPFTYGVSGGPGTRPLRLHILLSTTSTDGTALSLLSSTISASSFIIRLSATDTILSKLFKLYRMLYIIQIKKFYNEQILFHVLFCPNRLTIQIDCCDRRNSGIFSGFTFFWKLANSIGARKCCSKVRESTIPLSSDWRLRSLKASIFLLLADFSNFCSVSSKISDE